MGVLVQEGRVRYRVQPAFAWKGTLAKREPVEASTPKLTPVHEAHEQTWRQSSCSVAKAAALP
jgi:hypothetical protein